MKWLFLGDSFMIEWSLQAVCKGLAAQSGPGPGFRL